MLAVSSSEDLIATDDLLRWLHDPDPEVRALCEAALRGRNLDDKHLKLGRLITDARSEEHTSELQSRFDLVCRLLLEKKKKYANTTVMATVYSCRNVALTVPAK